RGRSVWDDIRDDLKRAVRARADSLTRELREALAKDRDVAETREKERFKSRIGEVKSAMTKTSIAKIKKELEKVQSERRQLRLFDDENVELRQKELDLEEELKRRTSHHQTL